MSNNKSGSSADGLKYVQYDVNKEDVYLDPIRQLIAKDLSGGHPDGRNIAYQLNIPLIISRALQRICLSIFLVPMGRPLLHGMAPSIPCLCF